MNSLRNDLIKSNDVFKTKVFDLEERVDKKSNFKVIIPQDIIDKIKEFDDTYALLRE